MFSSFKRPNIPTLGQWLQPCEKFEKIKF